MESVRFGGARLLRAKGLMLARTPHLYHGMTHSVISRSRLAVPFPRNDLSTFAFRALSQRSKDKDKEIKGRHWHIRDGQRKGVEEEADRDTEAVAEMETETEGEGEAEATLTGKGDKEGEPSETVGQTESEKKEQDQDAISSSPLTEPSTSPPPPPPLPVPGNHKPNKNYNPNHKALQPPLFKSANGLNGSSSSSSSSSSASSPSPLPREPVYRLSEVPIFVSNTPLIPGSSVPLFLRANDPLIAKLDKSKPSYVAIFMRRKETDIEKNRDKDNDSDSGREAQDSSSSSSSSSSSTRLSERDDVFARYAIGAVQSLEQVHSVGTYATIVSSGTYHGESYIMPLGLHRVRLTDIASAPGKVLTKGKITHLDNPPQTPVSASAPASSSSSSSPSSSSAASIEGPDAAEAQDQDVVHRGLVLAIFDTLRELSEFTQFPLFFLRPGGSTVQHIAEHALAVARSASSDEIQRVLEIESAVERLQEVLKLLKKELQVYHFQRKLKTMTEERFMQASERMMMIEQIALLKKKLGQDAKKDPAEKYRKRFAEKSRYMSETLRTAFQDELAKLEQTEQGNSAELSVTRNYLDWITGLPFGQYSRDLFDLAEAERILNEDHYGLPDVKQRILEFIAVGKRIGQVPQGKIICLSGPPGTGKTSVAKSMARALGRKFYRFAVGGLSDPSEIKGHRRTYVGALPGRIIHAIKHSECFNPVILIDEVDKMGVGHRGDPSAVLLEVLDPEQNHSFTDHFIDAPVDLSKVLFICTANEVGEIPGPLRDRMDFINLSGYVGKEKVHIMKEYLEPQERKRTGISESELEIQDDAVESLIRWYCREAGVRNLQKHVEKIYRKAALMLAKEHLDKIVITDENLNKFVGLAPNSSDRMYEQTPVGVVMGLAFNTNGGATLYIESTTTDIARKKKVKKDEEGKIVIEEEEDDEDLSGGALETTGQMGDVMKESTAIALTVAKAQLLKLDPLNHFFRTRRIHMHVPEGATPKDGPSAGITMVSSLLSLALDTPVKNNVAMTGEITLTGKVLRIGGLKEKLLAARRSMVFEVLIPKDNRAHFEELPDFIREGMTAHFVDTYDDVFKVIFPDYQPPQHTIKTIEAPVASPSPAQPDSSSVNEVEPKHEQALA